MYYHKQAGFSVVELMIVVAIVAILAGFSLKYLDFARKRAVCAEVETAAHETLLEAVKYTAQYNTAPPANATLLGVNLPAHVASIKIGGGGSSSAPITVNGTAVNNECSLGHKYILVEGSTKGTWQ